MSRFVKRGAPTLVAALGVVLIVAGCAGTTKVQPRKSAGVDFETFKARIVGSWAMVGEDGKPMPGAVLRSHTTANGSAVVETIFPGDPHEMVSVYYQDGEGIVMTHYCALGNAPQMALSTEGDTWTFVCDGHDSNFAATDMHMHEGVIEWQGPDRFRSRWTTLTDGEAGEPIEFEMVRID